MTSEPVVAVGLPEPVDLAAAGLAAARADHRQAVAELIETLERITVERDAFRDERNAAVAEAGRAREALQAIRELRNTATGWYVYETRDAGDCYVVEGVDDFLGALDAALDGAS